MKPLALLLLFGLLLSQNVTAQKPWRAKLFVHFLDSNNQIVTDTVWFGADSLGDIGYQPGLDVIDTAITRYKVLGVDSIVQLEYNTGCLNLKQNIQHIKKGNIDFKLYALGRVVAISWDTLDFIYKSDTNYWLTSAYLISNNAYLGAIDMTTPISICGLVDASGNFKFNSKDSIPVYSENTTISSCNYPYPTTHIELRTYFGYYNPTLGMRNYKIDNINLYPNPVSDFLNIRFTKPQTGILKIINTFNGTVLTNELCNLNHYKIEVSSLSNGIYLLVIENGGNQFLYEKIIIQH